jgi:hypothetical protein
VAFLHGLAIIGDMDIVGGLYRELCESPRWDQWFGSGARAAATVATFSGEHRLHTYRRPEDVEATTRLTEVGVEVVARGSQSTVVFSYLHPLSRPAVAAAGTSTEPAIQVAGDAVLRFGMIEGSAQVSGRRVVFDPQTSNWESFCENGSDAETLALVLNEAEIVSKSGELYDDRVAQRVARTECARVLVVKRGAEGADVYEDGDRRAHIPSYMTDNVFKIGSGDVFSAVFAYLWAEKGLSAALAADQASKAVAQYVSTRRLPLPAQQFWSNLGPSSSSRGRRIALFGSTHTLQGRWLLLEAEWCLGEMGLNVVPGSSDFDAALVLADSPGLNRNLICDLAGGRPLVWFSEVADLPPNDLRQVRQVSDFCSCIYWAAWCSAP